VTRLFRVHAAGASIHLEPVPVCAQSLDPNYVFVLDVGKIIYMWYGKNAKNTLKSKSRLMSEKINKNERKNKSEIITELMGSETEEFWKYLGADGSIKPLVSFQLIYCYYFNHIIYLKLF
jgi:hypothetical protein